MRQPYFLTLRQITLLLIGVCLAISLSAQTPKGFTYQAVVRDGGTLLTNQQIQVEFRILENGSLVYHETQALTTSDFGLFSATVGTGSVQSGSFAGIDWSSGDYALNVQVNPGSGLTDLGTNQIYSVPFSLYSQRAHTVDSLNLGDLFDVSGSPATGQVLKWDGSTWSPAADLTGGTGGQSITLTGAGATTVTGVHPNFTISSTDNVADADADPSNEIQSLNLSGTTISLSSGGGSVVLPYTAGTGISLNGTTIVNTGDTNPADDLTTSTAAGGDLNGTLPNPQVIALRGNPIATTAPTTNQVLKWNGTQWAPGTDASGSTSYTAGTGISISGNTITNTGDTNPADDLTTSTAAGGDLTGTLPNPQVIGLRGNPVANTAPNTNQVLKWNGTQWSPGSDANTTYNAGTGINISGNTIINTGDTNPADDLTTSTAAGGDLNGTLPNPQVVGLRGNPLATTAPSNNQVLKWNGTQWAPGSDANTTYSAGAGINLNGNTIENTGDLDASDDITTSTSAGGDLNGTFPNPQVIALRGNTIASTAPGLNQVLKWNGSQWAPDNDNSGSSIWSQSGVDAYYNSGDVGIGTTTPSGSLEVSANSSLSDPQIWLHENGNDYARVNFDNNNGSNYWTIAAYIASNHRNDRLNFWNDTGGDVMTITGDGEVGIGVGISPKVPFHIGNDRRVLFGTDTLGNGDKLMFLPDLHAFRVGTVATGAASTYWNRDSIGLYSFASGYNTRAQGFGATAMGRDTEATNSYAFASGFFSNADGQYSTAMGFNTDALALGATALGYSTDAEENYSFAAGYFAEAQAIYSVAIGNAVQAQSYSSMAIGRYNVGGGSATAWNANDPIFEIGIGTGASSTANAMTVQKDGDVGIGTASPGARLHVVNGNIRIGSLEEFSDGGSFLIQVNSAFAPETNGNRTLGTSTFRWSTVYATNGTINTSDRRDKEAIEPLPYGLTDVLKLKPVRYQWKAFPEQGKKLGLIAQDVQEVIAEVVVDKDWVTDEATGEQRQVEAERMGVYYSDLIPVLVQAIQDQQAIIDQQNKRMEEMEKRLRKLEK